MEARDPYCGWDHQQKRCTTFEESSNMNQWTQNITECPVRLFTALTVFYTNLITSIILQVNYHFFISSNRLWRWGTWLRMVVLVPGCLGSLATMTTARAPSAAACAGRACAMDRWPSVEGLSARAPRSRWQTVPGTVLFIQNSTIPILIL